MAELGRIDSVILEDNKLLCTPYQFSLVKRGKQAWAKCLAIFYVKNQFIQKGKTLMIYMYI